MRLMFLVLAGLVCTWNVSALSSGPIDTMNTRNVGRMILGNRMELESSRVSQRTLFPKGIGPEYSTFAFSASRFTGTVTSQDDSEPENTSQESSSWLRPALFIGGGLATTAILIRTDQTTYNVLHRWRTTSDPLGEVSPVITNLGDGRASMAIFGGFLAYSFIDKDNQAFQAGKIGLESFLVAGISTQILKHTFGRQRPSTATQNGGRWNGAYFLLNQGSGKRGGYASFDAFPSGHTATVFAAATTLAEVYHDSPWVSYASYGVATSVAISRVMERAHWLSDCFVGGLIGYFSTRLVLHFNHMDRPVVLLPTYDGTQLGLTLNVGL